MRRSPEGKSVIQAELEKHLDFHKKYAVHETIGAAVTALSQLQNPYSWGKHPADAFAKALEKIPVELRDDLEVLAAIHEYLEVVLTGTQTGDDRNGYSHWYDTNLAEHVLHAFPSLQQDEAIRKQVTVAVVSNCEMRKGDHYVGDVLADCIDPNADQQKTIDNWARQNVERALHGDEICLSALYRKATHTEEMDGQVQQLFKKSFHKTSAESIALNIDNISLLCGYAPELFVDDDVRESAAILVMENFANGAVCPVSVYKTLKINEAYFYKPGASTEHNNFIDGIRTTAGQYPARYQLTEHFVSPEFLRDTEEQILLNCVNQINRNYTLYEFKKLIDVFRLSPEFLARPEIVAAIAQVKNEKKSGGWGGWGGETDGGWSEKPTKTDTKEKNEKKLVNHLNVHETLAAMQWMPNNAIAEWAKLIVQIPKEVREHPDVITAVKYFVLTHCEHTGSPFELLDQLIATFPQLQQDSDLRAKITSVVQKSMHNPERFGDALVDMLDLPQETMLQLAIDQWTDEQIIRAKLDDAHVDMSALYRKVQHTPERDAAMKDIEAKFLALPSISFKPEGFTRQKELISLMCGYGHVMLYEAQEKARTILVSLLSDGVLLPPLVYWSLGIDDTNQSPHYDIAQVIKGSVYARLVKDPATTETAYSRHQYSFVGDDTLRKIEEQLLEECVYSDAVEQFYNFIEWFQPSQEFLNRPEVFEMVVKVEEQYLSHSANTSSWGKDGHYDTSDEEDFEGHWTPPYTEEKKRNWEVVDSSDAVFDCFTSREILEGLAMAKRIGMTPEQLTEMIASDAKIRRNVEKYEERLADQHRYVEFGEFLRTTGREMPIGGEELVKVLKKLVDNGMPTAALECLKVADEQKVVMDDDVLRGKITLAAEQEQERREHREPREIPRSRDIPKVAHQLAAFFYAESRVLQNIDMVLQEIPYDNIDLPFATNLRLREMQSDLRQDIETISLRLRQYLVVACTSELRHQDQLNDRHFDVKIPLIDEVKKDAKGLFSDGTDEENITYLAQAEARFLQEGWNGSYGGKKWAVIAETGMRLFRNPDDVTIMDYVFDLEHNTQAIFDKDPSIIDQDKHAMEALKTGEVLNAKRYAVGNSRQLIRVLREALPQDHALFDRLDRVVDRWMDVLRAVERSYLARGKEWKYEKYI